ncbi:MAG: class I SAM-dependent methyltransferase [Candidatus Hydrogenedentes bacterium]|nr:class I SAM-dependent methyltransferase [Candidatus Hydrogenedentota bacterium]
MLKDLYFRHLMRHAAARAASTPVKQAVDAVAGRAVTSALVRALREAASGDFSSEEQACICRIEAIRTAFRRSTATVRQPDWGSKPGAGAEPATITREVGELYRSTSKSKLWAGLLMKLMRECRPQACLELGTCLGISACYQAAGLHLNGSGRLLTLEGAPEFAAIAKKNFSQLGLSNVQVVTGPFQRTLEGALADLGPIDYAFIDGHHQEMPTLDYFGKICAQANPGAVFVFDDINWSDGMKRAWRTITQTRNVRHAMDLHALGICVYGVP